MGVIGEAIAAYAKPLIDQTDGSLEQLNKALAMSQFCWNLAIASEDERETMLGEMRSSCGLDDEEFEDFSRSIVAPMLLRHEEMFPRMAQRSASPSGASPRGEPRMPAAKRYAGTDRYAPCPCNSGKKYKFCCGASGR